MTRWITTSAFLVSCLCAQQLPDGADLVKQSQAAVKKLHSLQFTNAMEMEMSTGMKMNMESKSAMLNPGKTRTEVNTMGISILTVSDGNTTYIYNSSSKQYVKKNGALDTAGLISAMGIPNMPDISKIKPEQKTTGEETVEVDGAKHDCWVVQSRVGEVPLPGMQNAKMTDIVTTTWIDKKVLVDMQSRIAMKMQMPGAPGGMEVNMKMAKKDLKIDQPIPESLFQFTPPPDAKEVDNILGAAIGNKPDLAGKPAPGFEVKGLDGKSYSLAALKGKPVLLDFWATWCGPCRSSIPTLEKLNAGFKDQGLVVISVNAGEDHDTVAEFLKKNPVGYAVAMSGESGITGAYQVTVFPTFVLIGADGNVAAYEVGYGESGALMAIPEKAGLKAPKK